MKEKTIIGLHDAEKDYFKGKTFPNYALMKISAWHKAQGDVVEWWNPLYRYDRVYSSKIFDFTPADPYLYLVDDAGHGDLLDVVLAHKGPVILSGYENPLYNDRLRGWHREERICYSQVASKRKEVLWINFEPEAKEV